MKIKAKAETQTNFTDQAINAIDNDTIIKTLQILPTTPPGNFIFDTLWMIFCKSKSKKHLLI